MAKNKKKMNQIQNKTENIDLDFLNYAWDLEKQWRSVQPKLSDSELLNIFPEAREIIPEKIAEWQEEGDRVAVIIKRKLSVISQKSAPENQWFWREIVKVFDGPELLKINQNIERLKRLKSVSRGRVPKGRLTEEDIERARVAPIENVVNGQFKKLGNKSVALCPFHNEKTPSFYVYPENRFHCYGCGKKGDAISFVMELNGLKFPDAVRFLNGI